MKRGSRSGGGVGASATLERGNHLHLAQTGEPSERLELDLADTLAREAEALADFLECLRFLVDESVAQDEHHPLAVRQRLQRYGERLAAQRHFDALLGQRLVSGDEVAEHRVLLLADRLVEACRR